MTTLFSLPNMATSDVTRLEFAEAPTCERPKFAHKDEYRAWCNNKATKHAFVTGLEGLTPGLRVTSQNPPVRMHALIGEYDAAFAPKVANVTATPTWTVRSFSGNGRAIWVFEEPIPVDSETLKEFCRVAFSDIRAKRLAAGFEQEESSRPGQYFEFGDWTRTGDPVPKAVLWGWLAEASSQIKWNTRSVPVPFEAVRKEAEARFGPAWPGGWDQFRPGARGTRFWEHGADALSVIATEAGCVAFTGDKSFLSWADIFGPAWVREQHGGLIGDAIANIWWDETNNVYWRTKSDGSLGPVRKEDLRLHLKAVGLAEAPRKGERMSDVETAVHTLQMHRAVLAVAPLIFRRERVYGGILNISRAKPILPVQPSVDWGEGFPWLADYWQRLFQSGPTENGQLQYFLSWLSHFYSNAIQGIPTTGMALSIAGPNSIGKNFLGNAVLGPLVGGHQDASRYLTGEDQFNGPLMDTPLWTLHDAVLSSDPRARETFSQNLKRAVANREVRVRAMYREGFDVPWCGRVLTTLNLDPDSLRMVPSLEITIMEKLLLLRAFDPGVPRFPSDSEMLRELPYFGAYLRDYVVPDALRSERFGVRHWHHPDLVEAAQSESPTYSALELIDHWRHNHFTDPERAKKPWEGTVTRLLTELYGDPELEEISRRQFKTCTALGNVVSKLVQQGIPWVEKHRRGDSGRIIRILPPTA